MFTLLIDTAGPVVGLAAFEDDRVIASAAHRVAAGTEEWLGDQLTLLLPRLPRLDRVGVSVGPGAFTGIRVGVAAALGVAVARNVPVATLSSLALRACLAPGEARVLSVLDARKGRVYAGWFDTRGVVPTPLGPEEDILLADVAGPPGVAVGEGAVVFAALVASAGHRVHADAASSPVTVGGTLTRGAATVPAKSVGLRYLREPDARPSPV